MVFLFNSKNFSQLGRSYNKNKNLQYYWPLIYLEKFFEMKEFKKYKCSPNKKNDEVYYKNII